MSKKILMHSNDKVLSYLENQKGYVESVCDVFNTSLLPFQEGNFEHYVFKLQRWILENRASFNRKDINTLASFYGKDYIIPPNNVSLFNNYWIKSDKDLTTTWKNINPYDNWDINEDIIDILIHTPYLLEEGIPISFNSPNMTIPGQKERYWYKEGSDFYLLEPKNKRTTYPLIIHEQILCSKRAMPYISKEYELIPFSYYYDSIQETNISELDKIKITVEKYQLDRTQLHIGRLTDTYLIRDAKTLKVIDMITL